MKAILLAAGEGKRMRPLTLQKAKGMTDVLGKPLMHHIFNCLPDEIDEIILVVGYKGEQYQEYFGNEYEGRKITYVWQEEPLGTGHALFLCKDFIKKGERFLFLLADDLHSKKTLSRFIQYPLAVLVLEHEDPSRFGIVSTAPDGTVLDIEEKPLKPKTNLAVIGAYMFDDRIFNYKLIKNERLGEYFVPEIVNQLLKDHKMMAEKTDFWHPVGYPHDVEKAEKILQISSQAPKPDYSHIPAIIIAGGRGTRLPAEEQDKPKCLVEIAGKPILQWQIDMLRDQGFNTIKLALGYKAELVVEWLKTSGNEDVSYSIEKEPLGTGGGLRLAAQEFTSPFIAFNCDDIADVDFASLVRHGGKEYNVISGMDFQSAHTFDSLVCDKEKKICEFRERSPEITEAIVNIGHYYLQPDVFAGMPEKFSNERDLFPKLAQTGKLVLHTHTGFWLTANNAEQIKQARDFFAK